MFKNHLKIAWRNLVKHKVNAVINVLGLAIGLSTCLVIYLLTTFELNYDKFHPDKERIFRIVARLTELNGSKNPMGFIKGPIPAAMRRELTGFETVAAFHNYYAKVTIPNGTETPRKFDAMKGGAASPIIVAEPQYFEIFKYRWLAGSAAQALKEPFKVVLAESEARKYFGMLPLERLIGKEVIYNDSLRLTVSGIVQDWSQNSDFNFKDFISMSTVPLSFVKGDIGLEDWGFWSYYSQGFVKLAKGATAAGVEAQFAPFIKRHSGRDEKTFPELSLQPLSTIHFNEEYQDAYSRKVHLPTLYGLVGIALFILVIAVINFINLATAQSMQRAREIGIRKVLGSNKSSLVIQFLSETFILTVIAVLVSLLITKPVLFIFHSFLPEGLSLDLYNPRTLVYLAIITLVTTLLAGWYPGRVLSAYKPSLTVKGHNALRGGEKGRLRKVLIVFQFSISLIFIIGTIIMANQIHFMLNKDMGFIKDAIISIPTEYNYSPDQVKILAEKIRQLPTVDQVSISSGTPASSGHNGTSIKYNGIEISSELQTGDEHFIPLYQLRITEGRNIQPSDTLKELLVNETCAKALGFKKAADAIGKFVEIGMSNGDYKMQLPIVGVLADYHSNSMHKAIEAGFFTMVKKFSRTVNVKLQTRGKELVHFQATIASIGKIWKEIYPNEKLSYSFFDETIAKFYKKEEQASEIMNTAMAIAIFISCMGLFGLAAFTAEQRTREIGVRKVLGATVGNIVTMLSKEFIVLVTI
ncbi:MAG TPA: ABC transporter permease, partial [Puia sp.]|nr:ABC transporter permease [Puia sp.]